MIESKGYRIKPIHFWIPSLLIVQLFFLSTQAYSQQNTVSGTVTQAGSDELLPGVNVTVKGTTTGTATGADGTFSVNVSSLSDTLVFSFIGFDLQEVPINGRTTVDVSMTEGTIQGEDVVVVGYGTQRSQDVTGSVGIVSNENIEGLSISSPDEALTGQISGVQVSTTSGIPGGGPSIQVRGMGNIGGGGQPLYVVDGFALPQPQNESAARYRNPLADIPPQDIESISVLKDASATAIYGSRASNGVVVITTKTGSANGESGPQINISASSGLQNDIDWMTIDMSSARQFAEFQNFIWQARVDAGEASEVPELYRNPEQYGEGTDWFKLIRRENAPSSQIQASVSGGNETIRSYFSAGVRNDQGVIQNTSFQRLNFRANLEADLSNKLDVGLNIAPTYTTRSLPDVTNDGRGSALGSPLMLSPLGPAYDENGSLVPYPSQAYNNGEGSPGTWTHANPLYRLNELNEDFSGLRAIGTAFANYDFTERISARTSANVDWGNSRRDFFNPSTLGGINAPPPVVPVGAERQSRDVSFLSETTVSLNDTKVGPGTLNALAGFTAQTGDEYISQFSGQFPDDEIRTLNVASDITGQSLEERWSLLSVLGRLNYNLSDRYIFTVTARADGSSRFGSDNRWGTFPSGAIAWNLHNEPFLEGIENTFPELKLRVSYGLTGNNQIGNYSSLGTVVRDDYLYGGSVLGGRRVNSLANPELGWERTKEWNIGLDAGMLDQRLRFTIDAYQRTTTDLLLARDLPTSSGFGSVTENLGKMENKGIELSVSTVNVVGNDLNWTTDFNWSLNRNKVLELPGGEPIFAGGYEGHPSHKTEEGQPIGMMIGYVVDGIYQNQEDIDSRPSFEGAVPGNLIWRDVNGDGTINPGPVERGGDFRIIGNPHPDFTFGMTNNLSYRQFDLRVILTGRKGGDINRREYFRTALNIDGLFNVAADYVENFWRSPENPGDGLTPTPLGSGEARRRYRGEHTLNIYDGSNIWVRNATLRYNLPSGFAGIQRSNVYFSVDNPVIITSYPGNPEVQRNDDVSPLELGVDFVTYPLARQFRIGVELSL
jgi:TonB-linked SusC/RagA family outer membrane protein